MSRRSNFFNQSILHFVMLCYNVNVGPFFPLCLWAGTFYVQQASIWLTWSSSVLQSAMFCSVLFHSFKLFYICLYLQLVLGASYCTFELYWKLLWYAISSQATEGARANMHPRHGAVAAGVESTVSGQQVNLGGVPVFGTFFPMPLRLQDQ